MNSPTLRSLLTAYLRKHKRIHDNKELLCPQCPYVTNRKEAMETHISAQHKKQRVSCPAGCGYSTGYTGNMTKHLKKCTQHRTSHQPALPTNTFTCPSGCGYQATQPGNLARHTHHCKAFQGLVEAGVINPTSKLCVPVGQGEVVGGGGGGGVGPHTETTHSDTTGCNLPLVDRGVTPDAATDMGFTDDRGVIGDRVSCRRVSVDEEMDRGDTRATVTLQPLVPPTTNAPLMLQQSSDVHSNTDAIGMVGSHGNPDVGEVYSYSETAPSKFVYTYF